MKVKSRRTEIHTASDRHFLRPLAPSPATRAVRSPPIAGILRPFFHAKFARCNAFRRKVRVDVRFCGLTGSDVLLWRGEHRRTPEPAMVLGFEVSGTILEMGRLAHERTGYQMGEEVVVHNYPVCGGLAESCLAHYRPIALCDDARRAELCADLGATVIRRSGHCLPYKLKKIGGKEEVRVMIETEGGPCFRNAIKW